MRVTSPPTVVLAVILAGAAFLPTVARAEIITTVGPTLPVTFSAATETFTQSAVTFRAFHSVDGVASTRGWAIDGGVGATQNAYFTVSGGGFATGPDGSILDFDLVHDDSANAHILGHFRLFATNSSGTIDGSSTWYELTPTAASRLTGGGITINPGVGPANSVLLTSTANNPDEDTTFVTASVPSSLFDSTITGIRLEAIDDALNGLPHNGPGMGANNGNFVLADFLLTAATLDIEIELVAVPEPSTLALFGLALGGLGFLGYRQRRR